MALVVEVGKLLARTARSAERLCQAVAALAIAAMMVLVCVDVAAREFFSSPLIGNVEFIESYLMPASIWLALPAVQQQGRQIHVEFIYDRLPRWGQWVCANVTGIVIAAVMILICVLTMQRGIDRWAQTNYDSLVHLPSGLPWLMIGIGAGFTAVRAVLDLVVASPVEEASIGNQKDHSHE